LFLKCDLQHIITIQMQILTFFLLQGSGWNSNLLKWASGFIGSNEQSKNAESNSPVSFLFNLF